MSVSGASWGSVRDTDTLIEGARELLQRGCTAIAVVARFPEDEEIFEADDEDEDSGGDKDEVVNEEVEARKVAAAAEAAAR
jgi:hypothetical protein